MKKQLLLIFLIVVIFSISFRTCYSIPYQLKNNNITVGINIGIGLPKIPISHYRTPFSICGGIFTYFGITPRFALQVSGNGLYTFNLGSVLKDKSTLKFNLIWSDVCLDYKMKFSMNTETYLSSGIGFYKLFQQFDDDKDKVKTTGFTVGIITNSLHRKNIIQFEIRWHLLFKPEPKPQVLTVKIGFLL